MPETDLKTLIAQTYLQSLGLYAGDLDGEWGELSQKAAATWETHASPISTPAASIQAGQESTPYLLAKYYLGTNEVPGSKDNPLIVRWLRQIMSSINSEETAWCSAFVNAMALDTGFERSGKLNARSWLAVGAPVQLAAARQGDVVILWRVSKSSWEGHVAFLDHYNAKRGLLYLLGGNQADGVNITAYGVDRLLGVRRLRSLSSLQGNSSNRVV